MVRNMFKVNNKDIRNDDVNDVNDVVLLFLLLTLNIFQTICSVFIVNFEQVFVCWVTTNFQ